MDVSSNLESQDLVLGKGSPEYDPETITHHFDELATRLENISERKSEDSLVKEAESKVIEDTGNVENSTGSVSETENDVVPVPIVSTDSPAIDFESKMLDTSTDFQDVSNSTAELSTNLSMMNSEGKLEISDLTKVNLEDSKEHEVSTGLSEVNSEGNNMLEITTEVDSEANNDLLESRGNSMEEERLSSIENFVVEKFSALTENPSESSASFQRRRTEDISLVAYESSESEPEEDCIETVPQMVNGVNHDGTSQEILDEQSHGEAYEERLGDYDRKPYEKQDDYDEMEDLCDKEGELQIDESYGQESSHPSPEIERTKDPDESSINKSQESRRVLYLEDDSSDDSEDDRRKEVSKKTSAGGAVEKGEASGTKVRGHATESPGSLETQRKKQVECHIRIKSGGGYNSMLDDRLRGLELVAVKSTCK